jgi:Asp-tRNA(Asn)/Glu-tRNA(Gln) amidotransferase A subunit family amidase
MLPETFSAAWGTTCNPHDLSRTCGGSTGGEGALTAAPNA